jgi:hypothetical protein
MTDENSLTSSGWQDGGRGAEYFEKCWKAFDVTLQVRNLEVDNPNFLRPTRYHEDKPWEGELLIDYKQHPPYADQADVVCLVRVRASTKTECKEKLVGKAKKFLKRCMSITRLAGDEL